MSSPTTKPEKNLFLFMMDCCDGGAMYFLGLFDNLDPIKEFNPIQKKGKILKGHYFIVKVAIGEMRIPSPMWDLDEEDFVFGSDDWSYHNQDEFIKWQEGVDSEED